MSEPSDALKKFFNIPNWVEDTIKRIKEFSDRKIIVHNKFSEIPLDSL